MWEDVYPDPDFFHPGPRIQEINLEWVQINLSIFNPILSSQKYGLDSGSEIRDPEKNIPDSIVAV